VDIRITPLHAAAEQGHADVLTWLLEVVQVPVDPRDKDGDTPLHLAVHGSVAPTKCMGKQHRECAFTLLENKANPTIKCSNNKTPYQMAAKDEALKSAIASATESYSTVGSMPDMPMPPMQHLHAIKAGYAARNQGGSSQSRRLSPDGSQHPSRAVGEARVGRSSTPPASAHLLGSAMSVPSPSGKGSVGNKRERRKKVPFGESASAREVSAALIAQSPNPKRGRGLDGRPLEAPRSGSWEYTATPLGGELGGAHMVEEDDDGWVMEEPVATTPAAPVPMAQTENDATVAAPVTGVVVVPEMAGINMLLALAQTTPAAPTEAATETADVTPAAPTMVERPVESPAIKEEARVEVPSSSPVVEASEAEAVMKPTAPLGTPVTPQVSQAQLGHRAAMLDTTEHADRPGAELPEKVAPIGQEMPAARQCQAEVTPEGVELQQANMGTTA